MSPWERRKPWGARQAPAGPQGRAVWSPPASSHTLTRPPSGRTPVAPKKCLIPGPQTQANVRQVRAAVAPAWGARRPDDSVRGSPSRSFGKAAADPRQQWAAAPQHSKPLPPRVAAHNEHSRSPPGPGQQPTWSRVEPAFTAWSRAFPTRPPGNPAPAPAARAIAAQRLGRGGPQGQVSQPQPPTRPGASPLVPKLSYVISRGPPTRQTAAAPRPHAQPTAAVWRDSPITPQSSSAMARDRNRAIHAASPRAPMQPRPAPPTGRMAEKLVNPQRPQPATPATRITLTPPAPRRPPCGPGSPGTLAPPLAFGVAPSSGSRRPLHQQPFLMREAGGASSPAAGRLRLGQRGVQAVVPCCTARCPLASHAPPLGRAPCDDVHCPLVPPPPPARPTLQQRGARGQGVPAETAPACAQRTRTGFHPLPRHPAAVSDYAATAAARRAGCAGRSARVARARRPKRGARPVRARRAAPR